MKPHNIFFLLGFIFYFVLPVFVGNFQIFEEMPGMSNWHADYGRSKEKISHYLIIILLFLVSFYGGSNFLKILPKKVSQKKRIEKKTPVDFFSIIGYSFIFLILGFIVQYRSILFTGYETYDKTILGALATINIVSLIILFYLIFTSAKLKTKIIFISGVFLSSFVLIGLGSRIYVLLPVISMFTYKVFYASKKWHFKTVAFYGFLFFLSLLFVGAWRIGASFDYNFLIYLFVAEPVFTWWSTATFLANNELQIISYPSNYISSFLNFLPSFIFTNKARLIVDLKDLFLYQSPLGADSLFVNVQGNFGWFLGMFFFFFLGFYYSFIEFYSRKNNFILSYYIGIVSIIPFQLFRDNFGIINKQLFWNMLIVPSFIMFLILLIYNLLPKKQIKI